MEDAEKARDEAVRAKADNDKAAATERAKSMPSSSNWKRKKVQPRLKLVLWNCRLWSDYPF